MSAPTPIGEARRWLRYAKEDIDAGTAMLHGGMGLPRHVCWLCQQAAEKALKAVLVYLQIEFPYIHDLERLRNLIPADWSIEGRSEDLAELAQWAVESRYPADWPEAQRDDAVRSVRVAEGLFEAVRNALHAHGVVMEHSSDVQR